MEWPINSSVIQKVPAADLNSEASSPPGLWAKEKYFITSLELWFKGFYTHGDLQACNELLEIKNAVPSKTEE